MRGLSTTVLENQMFIALLVTFLFASIAGLIVFSIARHAADASTKAAAGGGTIVFMIVSVFVFFVFLKPWAFVDNYELGYVYDARDGQVRVLPHTGYVARTPFFESVHVVDLRPRQVCINVGGGQGTNTTISANQRVLNCKLVKFNPKGLALFISWHGRNNYEGETLDDLLKIYAYDSSGRTYPFFDVLRELKDDAPAVPVVQK